MDDEIRSYYEDAFEAVNYSGAGGVFTRITHRLIEKTFSQDCYFPITLEVGAAHAEHLAYINHSFDNYILLDLENFDLDIEDISRKYCTKHGGRVSFLNDNAENISLATESVDRVVHTCFLHHLDKPETALTEIRRVLKQGGVYTAYLPCDRGLLYSIVQFLTTRRKAIKYIKDNDLSINYSYLRAKEHPNHYFALRSLIEEVFKDDSIHSSEFFCGFKSYNLNFFTVLNITIDKSK